MIYLIYWRRGRRPRAHYAVGRTAEEVLAGEYHCICGPTASGKRHWTVATTPPPDAEMCRQCRIVVEARQRQGAK